MAMAFDSGSWKPRYDYSAFLSGQQNAMAEQQAEEDITKSILGNILSAQELPNKAATSNLEGALALAKMNDKEYIPAQLAGDIAKWQKEGYERDFTRDTLRNKTDYTNKDYQQKMLELIGKGIFTGEQNRALANVGSAEPTGNGQIGFSMVPETPKGPTPSALFATMQRLESGGKRFGADGKILTSPKGAMGENQVMPATAKDPGFGITPARDDSPDEIARVGREYLDKLYQRYQNPELALAAYNAGPGALDKILAKAQKTGVDWRTLLPAETQEYIRKSGYAGTETPQSVIAPFAKTGSDTPWSDQMSPQGRLGQMAAILGTTPDFAKDMAKTELQNEGKLAAAEARNSVLEAANRSGENKALITAAFNQYNNLNTVKERYLQQYGKLTKSELEQKVIEEIFQGKKPSQSELDRVVAQSKAKIDNEIARLDAQMEEAARLGGFKHMSPTNPVAPTVASNTIRFDAKGNRIKE